jgi:hypothetical protein
MGRSHRKFNKRKTQRTSEQSGTDKEQGQMELARGMLREFIPVACFLGEARSKVCHRERE